MMFCKSCRTAMRFSPLDSSDDFMGRGGVCFSLSHPIYDVINDVVMSDVDCTPGREPRSVAASASYYLHTRMQSPTALYYHTMMLLKLASPAVNCCHFCHTTVPAKYYLPLLKLHLTAVCKWVYLHIYLFKTLPISSHCMTSQALRQYSHLTDEAH